MGSEEFVEKLTAMPYGMTMGPMKSVPADESDLPPAAAAAFFDLLTDGAGAHGRRHGEAPDRAHGQGPRVPVARLQERGRRLRLKTRRGTRCNRSPTVQVLAG